MNEHLKRYEPIYLDPPEPPWYVFAGTVLFCLGGIYVVIYTLFLL